VEFGYGGKLFQFLYDLLDRCNFGSLLNSGMYHSEVEYWGFSALKLVVGKCENFEKLSF